MKRKYRIVTEWGTYSDSLLYLIFYKNHGWFSNWYYLDTETSLEKAKAFVAAQQIKDSHESAVVWESE